MRYNNWARNESEISSMFATIKQNWDRLKRGTPGQRFQQEFRRRQRSRRSVVQKAVYIAGGILIVAAGLFFLLAPGPGTIVLLVGVGVIAQQSSLAARALDSLEIRARKLRNHSWGVWRRSSPALKMVLMFLATALLVVVALGAYQLLLLSHDLLATA
jgi:hypothetical protein